MVSIAGQSQMCIGHVELDMRAMISSDSGLLHLDAEMSLMLCVFRTGFAQSVVDLAGSLPYHLISLHLFV